MVGAAAAGGRSNIGKAFAVAASPRRAFVRAVAIAAALHLPFVPTGLTALFDRLVGHHFEDYDDRTAEVIIPVDLDIVHEPSTEARAPAPPASATADVAAAIVSSAPAEPKAPKPHHPNDGGAPESSAAPDAGPAPLKDPVSVAGSVGKLATKDANVQVYVASDRLRHHELALNFAKMLVNLPEWASFFEGTGIDPLRDFDHLLIAGPKFKNDSSKVVAIVDYHVPDEAIRAGIDAVVKRSDGAWLEDTPIPAARAKAANRTRIFAIVAKKHLLAILPEGAVDQLGDFAKTKGFARSSKVGIAVSMVNPARPMGEVLPLPPTLAWMRLALTPTDDGGAELRLEFGDASTDDAERDAKAIEASYDKARRIEIPILGFVEALDAATFSTEGSVIRADVKVKEMQLRQILAFATARFGTPPPGSASAAAMPSAAPAPSGSPTAD